MYLCHARMSSRGKRRHVTCLTIQRTEVIINVQVAVKSMRIEIQSDDSKDKITQVTLSASAFTPHSLKYASQVFLNDYRARRQLRHENLVPLLGFTDGFGPLPAMVSPWMHNGSLTTYLSKNFKELKFERKLQIVSHLLTTNTCVFR